MRTAERQCVQWNQEKQRLLPTYHQGQKVPGSCSPQRASPPLESKDRNQTWAADDGSDRKRYTGIFCNFIYISIVVRQAAERKTSDSPTFHKLTGLVLKLKVKYRFSLSHQGPNPWSPWAATGTKATCSVDPGPVAVELSLNLLLASQFHEGPAVFHPLPLLGKFPAEPNQTKPQNHLFTLWGHRDL